MSSANFPRQGTPFVQFLSGYDRIGLRHIKTAIRCQAFQQNLRKRAFRSAFIFGAGRYVLHTDISTIQQWDTTGNGMPAFTKSATLSGSTRLSIVTKFRFDRHLSNKIARFQTIVQPESSKSNILFPFTVFWIRHHVS